MRLSTVFFKRSLDIVNRRTFLFVFSLLLASTFLHRYFEALPVSIPSFSPWQQEPSLKVPLSRHLGLYWNNHIYVLGGLPGNEENVFPTNEVLYARIDAEGIVGGWEETDSTGLPPLSRAAVVINDGWIYIVGGHDGERILGTTYSAHVRDDGSIADWLRSPQTLEIGRDLHQAVVFQDHLYVMGGYTSEKKLSDEVWVASLNDGQVGEWSKLSGRLREPLAGFASVVYRDRLYILGGWDGNEVMNRVYFTEMAEGIARRVYTDTTPLRDRLCRLTAFVLEDRLFVVGGRIYDPEEKKTWSSANVWSAKINPVTGMLGEWEQEGSLPTALDSHATIVVQDGDYAGQVYVIGGEDIHREGSEVQHWRRSNEVFLWPLISLTKEVNPSEIVYPSDQMTYTITYDNVGPRPLHDIIITDAVPFNTQLIPGSISEGGYSDGSVITWTIGELDRSESGSVSFQAKVVSTLSVTTAVSVPVSAPSSSSIMQGLVFIPHNLSTCTLKAQGASEQDRILCNADLEIEKSCTLKSAMPDQTVSYTLHIFNNGPGTAQDTIVVDYLPAGMTFVLAKPPPNSANPLSWSLGCIPSGYSQEIQLVAQVNRYSPNLLTNTVIVTSSVPDPVVGNNQDECAVAVVSSDLHLEKSCSSEWVRIGQVLSYTLLVQNDGPSDAHNVVVTETLPPVLTFLSTTPAPVIAADQLVWQRDSLVAGGVWEITIATKVNPEASAVLVNRASVSGDEPDPDLSNNHDEVQTQAPVRVVNRAYICEGGHWCVGSNTVVNADFYAKIYLPIILKKTS